MSTKTVGNIKKIKTILVSQPKPVRSVYFDLEKKWKVKIDWRPFIHVEPVEVKDFRKQRVKFSEYKAVLFTSKNAVDHFFRICEATREKMSGETKYFCLSEAIALYLQKYIIYRKRKVFFGKRHIQDMETQLNKFKASETFLVPCSDMGAKNVITYLSENEFNYQETVLYKTVSSDLSDLADITYDMLVFFSPKSIESLYNNFPKFKQNSTCIAAFGNLTEKAVVDQGLSVNVKAPTPESPSMTTAIENYLKISNKKK